MAESRAPFDSDAVIWRTPEGGTVSCVEKIKVMSQNFRELREIAKDTLEDAILMGCDETQVRAELVRLMESIESDYRQKR